MVGGSIRIEIQPQGLTRVFLIQPLDQAEADDLWSLYRVLSQYIHELARIARDEADGIHGFKDHVRI